MRGLEALVTVGSEAAGVLVSGGNGRLTNSESGESGGALEALAVLGCRIAGVLCETRMNHWTGADTRAVGLELLAALGGTTAGVLLCASGARRRAEYTTGGEVGTRGLEALVALGSISARVLVCCRDEPPPQPRIRKGFRAGLRCLRAVGCRCAAALLRIGAPSTRSRWRRKVADRSFLPPRLLMSNRPTLPRPPQRLPPRCAACSGSKGRATSRAPPIQLAPKWVPSGPCSLGKPPPVPRRRRPGAVTSTVRDAVRRDIRNHRRVEPPPKPAGCGVGEGYFGEVPSAQAGGSATIAVLLNDGQAPVYWLSLGVETPLSWVRAALERHNEHDGVLKRRRWRFDGISREKLADAEKAERAYIVALDALHLEFEGLSHTEKLRQLGDPGVELRELLRRKDTFVQHLVATEVVGKECEEAFWNVESKFTVADVLPRLPRTLPCSSFLYPLGMVPTRKGSFLSCIRVRYTDEQTSRTDFTTRLHCNELNRLVREGHTPEVAEFLRDSLAHTPAGAAALLNSRDEVSGTTPLHVAARHGHCETVRLLLSAGARHWVRDMRGRLPAHEAAQFGYADALLAFLEQEEEDKKQRELKSARTGTSSSTSAGLSDDEDDSPVEMPPLRRETPLDKTPQDTVGLPPVGLTRFPLLGSPAMVREGCRKLAAVCKVHDAPTRRNYDGPFMELKDRQGRDSLTLATQERHQACLRVLMTATKAKSAALDRVDEFGLSFFNRIAVLAGPFQAAAAGHLGVLTTWYETLGWSTGRTDGALSGGTLLHWACHHGCAAAVRYLIARFNEDPAKLNNRGWAPIHDVALRNDICCLEATLDAAGKERSEELALLPTREGERTIHIALRRARCDVDKVCLRLLNCSHLWDVRSVDPHGRSLLHAACAASRPVVLKELLERVDFGQPESVARAAVNSKDEDGITPLGLAIVADCPDCTSILLAHPLVDVGLEVTAGRSPLLLAVERRWLPPVPKAQPQRSVVAPSALERLLLGSGARLISRRPNASTRSRVVALTVLDGVPDSEVSRSSGRPVRKTPLHAAVQLRDFEMTAALLARRADALHPDGAGRTPLQMVAALHTGGQPLLRCLAGNTRLGLGSMRVLRAVLEADGEAAHDPLQVAELIALSLPDMSQEGPRLLEAACRRGQFNAATVLLDAGCRPVQRRPSAPGHRILPPLGTLTEPLRPTTPPEPPAGATTVSPECSALLAAMEAKSPDAPLGPLAERLFRRGAGRSREAEERGAVLAAKAGLWGVVRLALDEPSCNWKWDARCSNGRNALHYACIRGPVGDTTVVKMTRAGRQAIEQRDARGWLPYEYALVRPAPSVVLSLLSVSSPPPPRSYDKLCSHAAAAGVSITRPVVMDVRSPTRLAREHAEKLLLDEVPQNVGGIGNAIGRLRADVPRAGTRRPVGKTQPLFAPVSPPEGETALCRRIAWAAAKLGAAAGRDTRPGCGETFILLHWAVVHGDAAMLFATLEAHRATSQHGLVNARAPGGVPLRLPEGCTPLWVASAMGRQLLAEALLDVPCIEVDSPCLSGETPLGAASRQGAAGLAGLLLRHGASPAVASTGGLLRLAHWGWGRAKPRIAAVDGLTPLVAFARCCWQENAVDILRQMVDVYQCPTEVPHETHKWAGSEPISVLHTVLGGMPRPLPQSNVLSSIADCLADSPAGVDALGLDRPNAGGRSVIELAVLSGRHAFAAHLISKYRAPCWEPFADRRTAAHLMAFAGYKAGVRACIESVDREDHSLALRDRHGRTVIHCALMSCSPSATSVVELLLWEASPISIPDRFGRTALHLAARHGHVSLLKATEQLKVRIDYDRIDDRGCRPLHYAAAGGHLSDVQILLDCGVSTDARNAQGFTALDAAIATGQSDVAMLLLNFQGPQAIGVVADGSSPLHLAARSGLLDAGREYLRVAATVYGDEGVSQEMLREDNAGLTPLAVALYSGGMPIGRRLGQSTSRDLLTQTLWRYPKATKHDSVVTAVRDGLLPRYDAELLTKSGLAKFAYGEDGCWFMGRGIPHLNRSLEEQMWDACDAKEDRRLFRLIRLGDNDGRSVRITGLPRAHEAARAKRVREGMSSEDADAIGVSDRQHVGRSAMILRSVFVQALRPYAKDLSRVEWPSPEVIESSKWDRSVVVVCARTSEANRLVHVGAIRILDRWESRCAYQEPQGPAYRNDFREGVFSIIHGACMKGCYETLRHIINVNSPQADPESSARTKEVIRMHDQYGYQALHYACAKGHMNCAAFLIGRGVSPHAISHPPSVGLEGVSIKMLLAAPRLRTRMQQALDAEPMAPSKAQWLSRFAQTGAFDDPEVEGTQWKRPWWGPGGVVADECVFPAPEVDRNFVGDLDALRICDMDFAGIEREQDAPRVRALRAVLTVGEEQMVEYVSIQISRVRQMLLRVADGALASAALCKRPLILTPRGLPLPPEFELEPTEPLDLGELLQRVRHHLASVLEISVDSASAEELNAVVRIRCLNILRYSVAGGALGRELVAPVRRLMQERGVYGLLSLLMLKGIHISFVASAEEVCASFRSQDDGFHLEATVYCNGTELMCGDMLQVLDNALALTEVPATLSVAAAFTRFGSHRKCCVPDVYLDDIRWEAATEAFLFARKGNLRQVEFQAQVIRSQGSRDTTLAQLREIQFALTDGTLRHPLGDLLAEICPCRTSTNKRGGRGRCVCDAASAQRVNILFRAPLSIAPNPDKVEDSEARAVRPEQRPALRRDEVVKAEEPNPPPDYPVHRFVPPGPAILCTLWPREGTHLRPPDPVVLVSRSMDWAVPGRRAMQPHLSVT
eukprot:Hpha_TRINITY_DN15878_c2_g3::TRINITY_DN15878_c2_g3_i1::g.191566::m.191566